jgi:(2Fe-2S) ferredoxin/SAM-dependent methyltransferase
MEPFRYHVYACAQEKPEGVPCCSANGSVRVIETLRKAIASAGLDEKVQVTTCGSLGLCERGPNMVVYPEGVWYSGVTPDDVAEIVREHFQEGHVVERLVSGDESSLRSEIDRNKKKMLAALKAKEAAGMLPDDLQQTVRGYQESRVVLTAIELDLFTALGRGSDGSGVAGKLGTDPRATESLLNALVAMDLLEKRDGIYTATAVSARYFVEGAPDDARAALMHTVHLWPRWSTLTDCVREGTSVTFEEITEQGEEWTHAFISAMHRNAAFRAPLVVRAVGVGGVGRMLDVGGGSGAYSIAFARAKEDLHADVLDLYSVVPIAQGHIEEAGLSERVKTRVGDFRIDDFGSGYDLVFVSAICHMNGLDENRDLLAKSFRALAPSGRIAIQDFILDSDKTSPRFAALFALNMLVGTRAGSSYSGDEYSRWLEEAGFRQVHPVELPGPTGLIIGCKP